jgi:peptidoglycan/LPS O-acetylase OafA/YrhL
MTRYINRWTTLCAWAVLMGIVWALFVPRGVSITSFTLLGLTGAVFMVAASALWSAHQPTPSLRQTRVALEAAEAAARTGR